MPCSRSSPLGKQSMARSRIRGYGFANGRSDSSSHALAAKEKPAPVMNTTFSKELKSDSSDQVYPGPGHMWYRAVYALQVLAIRSERKSTRLNSSHGYISYAVF